MKRRLPYPWPRLLHPCKTGPIPWPITPIFECPPTRRTSRTRSSQCSTIATLKALLRIEFVEDTTSSGRRSWRDREIGRLLETTDAGDVLVAAEVSRLARSTLQVLEGCKTAPLCNASR